ncbi:hypothetical protein CCP2SC5_1020025 [Azospirillaceae bacterium]
MIKLIVKEPDGSQYWVERFRDAESAKAWADEEITRPYWVADRTFEFYDDGDPLILVDGKLELAPDKKAEREAKMLADAQAKALEESDAAQVKVFLKGLKKADLVAGGVDACATAIMKIVKHLRADK